VGWQLVGSVSSEVDSRPTTLGIEVKTVLPIDPESRASRKLSVRPSDLVPMNVNLIVSVEDGKSSLKYRELTKLLS